MIGVAVQARMSSTRLPAKVLLPVAGRPLLGYVLERVALAGETVVVATSDQPDDDPVAQFASDAGVQVFRGSLPDVAGRFNALADSFGLDALVRVSGDSPLIDPALVDEAISLFGAGEVDLVTNVFPRSFPVGQSVEVLSRAALDRVLAATDDPSDREHVTRYVYAHHKDFRIQNFAHERDVSDVRHVVDTEEDLRRVEAIFAAMERDHTSYGVEDLLALERG
jgi:spore coat polysaccharide biosynthesis protein SpsF